MLKSEFNENVGVPFAYQSWEAIKRCGGTGQYQEALQSKGNMRMGDNIEHVLWERSFRNTKIDDVREKEWANEQRP